MITFKLKKLILVGLVFSQIHGIVFADETNDLQNQLETLQQQAYQQDAVTRDIQGKIDNVSETLRAISSELNQAQSEYRAVYNDLKEVEDQISETEIKLETTEKQLKENQGILKKRIRNIYMHGQVSYLDVLFGAETFQDLFTRSDLLSHIIQNDIALVKSISQKKMEILKAKKELEDERAKREVLVAAAKEKADAIRAKKWEQDVLLDRMETDKEVSQRAYEELLAASRRVERLIRSRQSPQGSFSGGSGSMIMPVQGIITSEFGWRIHPITGNSRFHSGLDIGADYGDDILAAAPGTVICAGWISGYGYCVIVDHGNGITTLYGHNQSLLVSEGQQVRQGEAIAICGSTGNSTGPHCHFEVRQNGSPVSPYDYL